MDALDQQLMSRRLDRIEHKIAELMEKLDIVHRIMTTPPIILRGDPPTPEDFKAFTERYRDLNGPSRPLIVAGQETIEYIGPRASEE